MEIRDVTEGIDEDDLDRVLLDLPEPWAVVPHAARALRPGGIFLAYLPTINQTAHLRAALDQGPFAVAETVEVLRRTWHVEARSVRPDHRMVAHTGFLTTARRVVAGRPTRGDATDHDDADAPGTDGLDGHGGPDGPALADDDPGDA